ncbi:MAG: squalene/phytoene synthase family protein [Actinomycetota bacterium]|nr:squalene/phytoene synthase family protein [Actinomycetota bacterium]
MNSEEAYRYCEQLTASQARNFSYGIRLLDPVRRRALSAVYALARRIDDIGDGPGSSESKLERLAKVRQDLKLLPGDGSDPVLVAIADSASRFAIPLEAFDELIQGCEWDCHGSGYDTFDDLVTYCRLVAGSIGRLSLGVFGAAAGERAPRLADQLGVALQLTNILRDIREDREQMGRVYLPARDLERFGAEPDATGPPDAVVGVILLVASRARSFYTEGLGLLSLLDWRSRACTAAMAGIYRRLLGSIERRPESVLSERVSLSRAEKAWVAALAIAGRAP